MGFGHLGACRSNKDTKDDQHLEKWRVRPFVISLLNIGPPVLLASRDCSKLEFASTSLLGGFALFSFFFFFLFCVGVEDVLKLTKPNWQGNA